MNTTDSGDINNDGMNLALPSLEIVALILPLSPITKQLALFLIRATVNIFLTTWLTSFSFLVLSSLMLALI